MIDQNINLTHLLFVDDVLLFYCCNVTKGEKFESIVKTFFNAMGTLVNLEKYSIYFLNGMEGTKKQMIDLF